ncbi:MAG: T9SS type A sorting domain-containing protein [Bacteroidota bacterium]
MEKLEYLTICFILFLSLNLSAQLGEIPDAATWEEKFDAEYASVLPHIGGNNDNDEFAWHGHYWLRAYGNMANYTGDIKWVDLGFELIDYMFTMTDRERWRSGELSLNDLEYGSAYLDLWQLHWCQDNSGDDNCAGLTDPPDSVLITISWRRPHQGVWKVEALNDGMIIHGMMRFVNSILSDSRFSDYENQARAAISKCTEIAELHVNNYSFTKNATHPLGPGGFYYTRANQPFASWADPPSDARLYNDGRPLNHSTTMSAAMLLIDKWDDRPDFRRMADSTLMYFLRSVWEENDAYVWHYHPRSPNYIEDVGHGSVDLSLVTLMWEEGSDLLDDEIMQKFANVVSNNLWDGDGDIHEYVDGTGQANGSTNYAIAYDYIDFAPWDTTIVDKAEQTLLKHAANTSAWSRPMLGWSNILRWRKVLEEDAQTTQVEDPSINLEGDIYPNPTFGRAYSSIRGPYSIYNSQGMLVEIRDELELSHLPNGLYLIRFSNGAFERLVKR